MGQELESAASLRDGQQRTIPNDGPLTDLGSRAAPQSTLEAARRVGSDIQVAMAGWDPASADHVLFLPPAGLGDPVAPIRVRTERSLLPRLLERDGPLVANDLAHPTFDEERDLSQRGIRACVAIRHDAPGWNPGVALFASTRVQRFDAVTVAALRGYLEEAHFAPPPRRTPTDGSGAETNAAPGTCDRETLIGESLEFLEICRLIALVARRDTTVLIQGESGTGKEMIARAIHQYSQRADRPFIRVNCAALTETLIESEMFGHRKGAFTGAVAEHKGRFGVADGGTLLLDEIGSMSLSGQAKILRVLQEREFEPVGQSVSVSVDVRVLATTNVELERAISEGTFRQDLYFRLAVVPLTVPPLRSRRKDIIPLAEHFLAGNLLAFGRPTMTLSVQTRQLLVHYNWPGNARELKNAIEYAVLVARGNEIRPEHLPHAVATWGERGTASDGASLRQRLLGYERDVVVEALDRARGVRKEMARLLGIDPRNVSHLLRKHNIR